MSPIPPAGRAPLLPALLVALVALGPAAAQTAPPRIGVGFDVATPVTSQDLLPTYPAVGIRGRVALPVNADVSVAASLGIGAHIFEGRRDTEYVASPQAELIVTLGRRHRSDVVRYAFGGFGGVIPFDRFEGGPTLHVGYGWAVPLREASAFVEVNPSVVIGEREVAPLVSARAGVIF